jgi:hypothetical protein
MSIRAILKSGAEGKPAAARRACSFAAGAAALCLLLGACGSSSKRASAATRTLTSTGAGLTSAVHQRSASSSSARATLTVHLQAPSSEPKSGGKWPITVTAQNASGKPVNGTVSYAFLFGGAVVARRPGGQMKNGIYHDQLEFPAQALGYPLTLEVIVEGEGGRGTTTRAVKVER